MVKKEETSWEGFDHAVARAKFEIEHDPYRGMMMIESDGRIPSSPWSPCVWENRMQDDAIGNAAEKVFTTCHCTCPSLTAWTEQQDQARRKKKNRRKRKASDIAEPMNQLGRRPEDSSAECDFNPLCLVSLGGIVDDILAKRAKRVLKEDEPEVIELDETKQVIELDDATKSQHGENGKTKPAPVAIVDSAAVSDVDAVASGVHWQLDPNEKDSVYSSVTAQELKEARQTCRVERVSVESYVRKTILPHIQNPPELQNYMELLNRWHSSVVFSNPIAREKTETVATSLTLSLPPGILNLGATCYLNTQLQCLAQNLAFLDGIFSWHPSEEVGKNGRSRQSMMNSVLSTLQLLLARMVYGGQATVTTQEFSTALGLENDEMQDPNEFARLLFERMHESFSDNEGLSNLLPSLFEGITTYETTCRTCDQVSERRESFMDLNVPIVKPSKVASPSLKGGQQTISDAFAVPTDTNVQYCLDQYLHPEELSGDNQYWCERCQCKRDAERAVTFQNLPPVLNVQISRYVFDRVKFVKKKLNDKVLLPRTLCVPKRGSSVKIKYMLCAVMKHQGNSAYQGHYVAEAMDWNTGTWFEFNDSKVTALEKGPSCSYEPREDASPPAVKKGLAGSTDAYNMYYVREDFLAKSVATNLLQSQGVGSPGEDSAHPDTDVLAKVATERKDRYSLLTEMCQNDGLLADRLTRRRNGIEKHFSEELVDADGSFSFRQMYEQPGTSKPRSPVWVDGSVLLQFFSCNLEKEQASSLLAGTSILSHRHLLCEHKNGFHPRVARRGKLLPRRLYDACMSLLLEEKKMHDATPVNYDDGNDCLVTPERNLFCGECASSYNEELSCKLNLLERLKQLFHDLDAKKETVILDNDSSGSDAEEESFYFVSKKFVTKFRAMVGSTLKSIESLHANPVNKNPSKNTTGISLLEGLDAVDISPFVGSIPTGDDSGGVSPKKGADGLDLYVNSAITCEHGNLSETSRRSVRRISGDVWNSLVTVFPQAIAHKHKIQQFPESDRDALCPLCQKNEKDREEFGDLLQAWATETQSSISSKKFLRGKRSMDEVLSLLLEHEKSENKAADRNLHLVHRDDLTVWRKALSLAKSKKDSFETKQILKDMLLRHNTDDADSTMKDTKDGPLAGDFQSLASSRRLICSKHSLVCENALFPIGYDSSEKDASWLGNLNTCVEALMFEEYVAYVRSICSLGALVSCPDTTTETWVGEQTIVGDDYIESLSKTHHPVICSALRLTSLGCDNETTSQPDHGEKPGLDNLILCKSVECNRAFVEDLNDKSGNESGGRGRNSENENPSVINLTDEPEKNCDDTFSLRVFEIEKGKAPEVAAVSILPQSLEASEPVDENSTFLRRSGRKRNTKYPSGGILSEGCVNVKLEHNLAAVRLFIMEKCPTFQLDHQLTLVLPSTKEKVDIAESDSERKSVRGHTFIALPFEWSSKTLEDVFVSVTKDRVLSRDEIAAMACGSFLCTQQSEDGDDGSAKRRREKGATHETLMDSLLEMANTGSDKPDSRGKAKKKRRTERGFRGTFLHSSSTIDAANKNGSEKEATKEDKEESAPAEETTVEPVGGNDDRSTERDAETKMETTPIAETKTMQPKQTPLVYWEKSDSDTDVEMLSFSPFDPAKSGNKASTPRGQPQSRSSIDLTETLNEKGTSSPILIDLDSRTLRSSRGENVLNRLFDLLSNGGFQTIDGSVRNAVKWALSSHPPNAPTETMVDAAFAKYLESYDG